MEGGRRTPVGGGLWELERGAAALGGAASARRRRASVDRDRNRGIAEEGRGEKNGWRLERGIGAWGAKSNDLGRHGAGDWRGHGGVFCAVLSLRDRLGEEIC